MNAQVLFHDGPMSPAQRRAAPVPALAAAMIQWPASVLRALARARVRDRDRAHLAELDDRMLRDIGLTREQVGPRPEPLPFVLW